MSKPFKDQLFELNKAYWATKELVPGTPAYDNFVDDVVESIKRNCLSAAKEGETSYEFNLWQAVYRQRQIWTRRYGLSEEKDRLLQRVSQVSLAEDIAHVFYKQARLRLCRYHEQGNSADSLISW